MAAVTSGASSPPPSSSAVGFARTVSRWWRTLVALVGCTVPGRADRGLCVLCPAGVRVRDVAAARRSSLIHECQVMAKFAPHPVFFDDTWWLDTTFLRLGKVEMFSIEQGR